MNPAKTVSEVAAEARRQTELVNAVLERLSRRRQLAGLAREILSGLEESTGSTLPSAEPEFFGEKEVWSLCGPAEFPIRHECGTGNFDCADKFDCREGFFDCGNFECGAAGGASDSFQCQTTIDFICGGSVGFDCAENFDCSGGHVFACMNNVECAGTFGCNAGGTDCVAGTHRYNIPLPGPDDTTAGDFICGHPGPEDDTFNCSVGDFDCCADDDFHCLDAFECVASSTAAFECCDGTSFNCGAGFDYQLKVQPAVQVPAGN
ncbi:MAG TPA: hypothetical protein VJP77_00655 [Planctomycetota bacterium]|nr:hypothetical protein [Planctomycetota bacterium]